MEVDFLIIGGGLSGLMAAAYFKEPRNKVVVVEPKERGKAGLSQHKAVMRLRTPAVAELLGLKTEKILVQKAVYNSEGLKTESSIRDSNVYSQKVAGIISPRSIGNLGEVERYRIKYQPHYTANYIPITYDDAWYTSLVTGIDTTKRVATVEIPKSATVKDKSIIEINYQYCISTIPLFVTLSIVFPMMDFVKCEHNPIWTKTIHLPDLPMDQGIEQTVYIARDTPTYRITLRPAIRFVKKSYSYEALGSELLIESMEGFKEYIINGSSLAAIVSNCFGINLQDYGYTETESCQPYGKLIPVIDEKARRAAIFSLTQEGAIYSLGRHAIWKSITADRVLVHLKRIAKMLDTDEIVRKSKSKSMEAEDD